NAKEKFKLQRFKKVNAVVLKKLDEKTSNVKKREFMRKHSAEQHKPKHQPQKREVPLERKPPVPKANEVVKLPPKVEKNFVKQNALNAILATTKKEKKVE